MREKKHQTNKQKNTKTNKNKKRTSKIPQRNQRTVLKKLVFLPKADQMPILSSVLLLAMDMPQTRAFGGENKKTPKVIAKTERCPLGVHKQKRLCNKHIHIKRASADQCL